MLRLFILNLVLIFFVTNAEAQNTVVDSSSKFYNQGMKLMEEGFKAGFDSNPTTRNYFKKAIKAFLSAYHSDTSNIELATNLPYLYYELQKFDSSLIWGLKLLPIDSINYFYKSPTSYADKLKHIGFCYLNFGDIKTAELFLVKSLTISRDHDKASILQSQLMDLSDKIYFKKYQSQIKKLQTKKIDPCRYSIEIMNLGLKIGKDYNSNKIKLESIQEKEKNCK